MEGSRETEQERVEERHGDKEREREKGVEGETKVKERDSGIRGRMIEGG